MKQPILYCVFNRLDVIKETFIPIIQYKPGKLYIASDGARDNVTGEKELIEKIRKYLLDNINWNCEVHTLFQKTNLGCDNQMTQAIRWFFENEEMGIVLEDDIVATMDFFDFCSQMLTKYRYDDRINCISGICDISDININYPFDYAYSNLSHFWGWAAWRRSLVNFDTNVADWTIIKHNKEFKRAFCNKLSYLNFYNEMETLKLNCPWDLAFKYLNFKNFAFKHTLCIIPANKRLVSNIGYDGTHAIKKLSLHLGWSPDKLDCNNLKHPVNVELSQDYISELVNINQKNMIKKLGKIGPLKILFKDFVYSIRFVSQFLKLILVLANKDKRQHRLCRILHLRYDFLIFNHLSIKKMTGH